MELCESYRDCPGTFTQWKNVIWPLSWPEQTYMGLQFHSTLAPLNMNFEGPLYYTFYIGTPLSVYFALSLGLFYRMGSEQATFSLNPCSQLLEQAGCDPSLQILVFVWV